MLNANDKPDKWLIAEIYKELTLFNTKKKKKEKKRKENNPIEKWAEILNTHFSGGHTEGPWTCEKILNVTNHREMEIKITIRDNLTPARMAVLNK